MAVKSNCVNLEAQVNNMISFHAPWYVLETEAFCLHSVDFALTLL